MTPACPKTFLALVATLACGLARADSNFNMPDGSNDISLSMTAFDTARSEGGTRRQVGLLPSVTARWSNGIFASIGEVGWDVSDDPVLDYGPLLSYDLRQRRSDDASGKGGGLDIEGGAFVHYMFAWNINFNSAVLYGGGADRGGVKLVADADYSIRLGPHASLTFSPGFELANAAYMKSTFGITPAQAAVDHLASYEAHPGMKNVFFNTGLSWQVANKWTLDGGVNTRYFVGSAAHSPLTQKRTDATVYLSLSYHY